MRIFYLTHHFQTPDEPGAPRPWKVASALTDQGHDVFVLTAGVQYMTGDRTDASRLKPWTVEEVEGVTIVRTWAIPNYRDTMPRRVISYFIYSILALLASFRLSSPSIVLTGSGVPPFITATGYLIAKTRSAAFVVEERDLYPEVAIELGHVTSPLLVKPWKWYHKFFRMRADLIIALTPGIERRLVEKGIPEDRIELVTNAYDRENDELLKTVEDPPYQDSFVVLYTGGMGQVNELDTLLQAAERLTDVEDIRFVLVGEGERRSEYEQFCEEHDLTNVDIVGPRPKREMPMFYTAADVCVQLTPKGEIWRCVLSNKIFDYLGHGCPMIFAGAGDSADMLADADAGIVVEPENPDALVDAILELYDSPEDRELMGERAREYILENYTRAKTLETMERHLRRVG